MRLQPSNAYRSSGKHLDFNSCMVTSSEAILPRLCTKFGKRAFFYAGPQTWNALPENIRHETSPNCFKRQLKTFLFC